MAVGGSSPWPLSCELRGHDADAVTLEGLDPDAVEPPSGINLTAHVRQVVDLLVARPDDVVVLVGHSYAGSVITGVADQRPTQVQSLIYLDAFVPSDGDSCWSMTNEEQRKWYVGGSSRTGLAVDPLPFFDDRARPQPIGTLMQASTLAGDHQQIEKRTYAVATDPQWTPHSPFVAVADRLRSDPRWTVIDLDSTHNMLAKGTDLLRELLLEHA